MLAYYGDRISEHMTKTPEGYLICHDVKIARIGQQEYLAVELGLQGLNTVKVDRMEEDVFDPATLASFEGKDVTNGHPEEPLCAENQAAYSKGHAENVRRDGDYIIADLHIKDPVLISEVENGITREVSCGYSCTYEPSGNGYKQTHIRGNHIAIVPLGRAGHSVAIQDSAIARKGNPMADLRKGILTLFGKAAKDATQEELETMAEDVKLALDAAPAEEAPEADPAEETEDADPAAAPAEDAAPEADPIAALTARIEALEAQLAEKAEHDAEPEADPDEGDNIDKAIEALTAEKKESAATIPADDSDCAPTSDSGVKLLQAMRSIVADIKDEDTRKAVSKGLIDYVKGADPVNAIHSAAQDSANAAANSTAKTNYTKICEAQQAAYDKLNPHKNKNKEA